MEPSGQDVPELGDETLILRRREGDWSGSEREPGGDMPFAAQRAAVSLATATLAAHDGLTAGHSDDVVTLSAAVGERLGLDNLERSRLVAAAQLHDLGKVAVPASVLDKPGPLDAEEWAVMREHTVCGERILSAVPELSDVGRIVRASHERWDGSGYPDGMAGEEIPLESRIVFCADAFHAVRSDRPYRSGRAAAEAMAEIRRHSGTQFDPRVVAALEEEARVLRSSAASRRMAALGGTVRSRRLVSLLVALTVSGGAFAVAQGPLSGGEDKARAASVADCDRPCVGALSGLAGPWAWGGETKATKARRERRAAGRAERSGASEARDRGSSRAPARGRGSSRGPQKSPDRDDSRPAPARAPQRRSSQAPAAPVREPASGPGPVPRPGPAPQSAPTTPEGARPWGGSGPKGGSHGDDSGSDDSRGDDDSRDDDSRDDDSRDDD